MDKQQCSQCEKFFNTKEALDQHTRDKHISPVETPKKKSKISKYLIIIVTVLGLGILAYFAVGFFTSPSSSIGPLGSTHIHTDFAIYLSGQQITPLPSKYFVRSPFIHMESGPGVGTVIHMHATNVPLNFFFKSLGMSLTKDCFTLDNGSQYCNSSNTTLKFFVKHAGGSWQSNDQFGDYIFKDLDKIIISYGNETDLTQQENSVTDFAKDNSDRPMPA